MKRGPWTWWIDPKTGVLNTFKELGLWDSDPDFPDGPWVQDPDNPGWPFSNPKRGRWNDYCVLAGIRVFV